MVVGLTIVLANVTMSPGSGAASSHFSVAPNGTFLEIYTILYDRQYEIRVTVPKTFEGALYVFDYEGMRKLAEGTRSPILEESINGSVLIDFKANRRGAYSIMIESHTSMDAEGMLSLAEIEALSWDLISDATVIMVAGIVLAVVTLTPKIGKVLKVRHAGRQQKSG